MKEFTYYVKTVICICCLTLIFNSCKKEDTDSKDADNPDIPKITLKTSKAIGENFDMIIQSRSNQDIWVDYGDGNKVKATSSAKVNGETIKIYYDDKLSVSYLEFFGGNKITAIDLKNAIGLENLIMLNALVSNINLSANINLKDIKLLKSEITSIELPKSTKLERFELTLAKLNSIDLSNVPNLVRLVLEGNNLQSLDISKNNNLKYVSVTWNAIKQPAMSKILEDLPMRTVADNATIWIDDKSSGPLGNLVERNERPNAEAITNAKSKNWNLYTGSGIL